MAKIEEYNLTFEFFLQMARILDKKPFLKTIMQFVDSNLPDIACGKAFDFDCV